MTTLVAKLKTTTKPINFNLNFRLPAINKKLATIICTIFLAVILQNPLGIILTDMTNEMIMLAWNCSTVIDNLLFGGGYQ